VTAPIIPTDAQASVDYEEAAWAAERAAAAAAAEAAGFMGKVT
jgi:hypothetical protein